MFTEVLLRWCPQDPSYFRTTALASFLFGLTSTWAGPAVDRPIWSELAPDNSAMAMAVWTFIAGLLQGAHCGSRNS
eukprot:4052977-Amphidinium_carterae.1